VGTLKDPASALAELMNQRSCRSASQPVSALQGSQTGQQAAVSTEETADSLQIENIASLVCRLLSSRVKPWLTRKLNSWPSVIEDADDLGQLAALAFIEAYRQDRIKPDQVTQIHTASSVSAYLWGICNKIFVDSIRRSKRQLAELNEVHGATDDGTSTLDELLAVGKEVDDESRLWEVLSAVEGQCRPQDIIVTWLHGCGFSVSEIRELLGVSVNTPANAVKRVGGELRKLIEGSRTDEPTAMKEPVSEGEPA
jgi:DNA-directed RNA polymerase specialized sigma24 family protein